MNSNDTMSFSDAAVLVKEKIEPSYAKGMRYIGLKHIKPNSLDLSGHGYAEDVASSKTMFKKGDILFGKLRPYFRKVIRAPFDGICSTDIWVIRSKKHVDQIFLYYWVASQEFVDGATRGSEGTIMPRAKWDYIRRFKTPISDKNEQVAIGQVLKSLDDKIESNRQMSETLEETASTLFKSWFVHFDPVKAKIEGSIPEGMSADLLDMFPNSFEDSDLGPIPAGWKIESMDKVANFTNGLALQKCPAEEGCSFLPVIKIAEIKRGITQQTAKASTDIPKKFIIDDGDVLFSWSGSLTAILWPYGKGALNQHLFKVTSEEYPKWFYYYWVWQYMSYYRRIASSKATTMGHIKRQHLSETKSFIPPKVLLREVDKIFAPILSRVVDLGKEIRCLTNIHDKLLPKLISGELRVKDVEGIL